MRLIFTLSLISLCILSSGQELPVYNQYVFDPYLINPSYIGQSGYSEINLLYRTQWTGIEDAPTTIGANFQYVANPRVSLGINLYNQEVVMLSTTSAMATFGYRVPINRNNNISFGLSVGAFSNRIDLTQLSDEDLNDPVFAQINNNFKMDGQFGLNYSFKRLTIGFSLLRLFENDAFINDEDASGIKFSELNNKAVSASYSFNLSKDIEFMPYVLYRFTDNYNFVEGTGVFTYKNLISLGGFYRQDYGPGFLVRLRIKGRMEIGYGHEFANNQAKNYLGGSHEVQFKLKVGKKSPDLVTKREERTIDSTATSQPVVAKNEKTQKKDSSNVTAPRENVVTTAANPPAQNTPTQTTSADKPVTETANPPAVAQNQQQEQQVTKPVVEETKTPVVEEPAPPKPKQKYLLVIGTFHSASNAIAFVRTAKAKGLKTEMVFSQETGYYYVYAPEYIREDPTVEELLEIRDKIPFKDAWFKSGLK
jgi:type IX secretion system PorP/SprF family membrane protein